MPVIFTATKEILSVQATLLADEATDVSVNGNIDEVRVTKGVARYTSPTYIVPPKEFPNS